jgi:hypothetical protein
MKEEDTLESREWRLIGCSRGTKVDATSCGIYLEDTYSIPRPVWSMASLSDDASPTISVQSRPEEV